MAGRPHPVHDRSRNKASGRSSPVMGVAPSVCRSAGKRSATVKPETAVNGGTTAMEVRGSLRVMLRRWPVIIVGLLVLAVGMVGITKATRTQSQATLTVLLTGPGITNPTTDVAQTQNPLLPHAT